YVRLWSLLPTGWQSTDYTFTAATSTAANGTLRWDLAKATVLDRLVAVETNRIAMPPPPGHGRLRGLATKGTTRGRELPVSGVIST
ncbi:MAG: hypothetical protein Q7R30_01075, partial [Acidobacteriota bacterium]|nr:hypothetical protein [Acidobacteriota bacterium]